MMIIVGTPNAGDDFPKGFAAVNVRRKSETLSPTLRCAQAQLLPAPQPQRVIAVLVPVHYTASTCHHHFRPHLALNNNAVNNALYAICPRLYAPGSVFDGAIKVAFVCWTPAATWVETLKDMRKAMLLAVALLQLATAATTTPTAAAAAANGSAFLTCDSGEQSGSVQACKIFLASN
jgi:hypothetical protein